MDTLPPRDAPVSMIDGDALLSMRADLDAMRAALKRLLEERRAAARGMVRQSVEIGELMAALSQAQGEIVDPEKNKTAKVTSEKGSYTFAYADLTAVKNAIRAPLSKAGIAYSQIPDMKDDGGMVLVTRLQRGEQWIESVMPLPRVEKPQAWASTLTYLKRYVLCAILGLATDGEDDDGNMGQGNAREIEDRRRGNREADGPREARQPPPRRAAEDGDSKRPGNAELKAFQAKLKAALEGADGDALLAQQEASRIWLDHEGLLRAATDVARNELVARFRRVFGGNPPALDGVKYPPAPPREDEAANA